LGKYPSNLKEGRDSYIQTGCQAQPLKIPSSQKAPSSAEARILAPRIEGQVLIKPCQSPCQDTEAAEYKIYIVFFLYNI
jgi:hypothetical protein